MEKLNINLKFCYGIKSFEHTFDFTRRHAHVIYAPNGSMKSSFAKTFKDLSKKQNPRDIIKPSNPTECTVLDEKQEKIPAENIFVIESEPRNYDSVKRQEALLVNIELEAEYNETLDALESKKKEFLNAVSSYSGGPRKIESLFTEVFEKPSTKFYDCLEIIKDQVENTATADYSDILYEDFFNKAVIDLLKNPQISSKLSDYIEQYDKLTESSPYFKKGAFDHDNAAIVCSNLETNGFFKAQHKVLLNSGEEISEAEKLEDLFTKEKQRILSDEELEKRFSSFDNAIKNKALKTFRTIVQNRKEILKKLENVKDLKIAFWASYFRRNKDLYHTLLNLHNTTKDRLKEIEEEANTRETEWESVLETFKGRFDVPFNIEISNKSDVGLGRSAPVRSFKHKDADEEIEENNLKDNVLSTGERRALYILNIIFEIRSRAQDPDTLIIIDDIADSFDYKNKYAIVEYLSDILEEENFKAIILTHNFDFFRTLESRLEVKGHDSCHIILKNNEGIKLEPAKDYLNAALRWKEEIESSTLEERNKLIVAAIPLVRNLIEYTEGKEENYTYLTKLLHMKDDTADITIGSVCKIFNAVWKTNLSEDETDKMLPIIYQVAENCLHEEDFGLNLENKIVLSIATRLKAEEFLNSKISSGPQAPKKLGKKVGRFKEQYPNDNRASTLEKVLIMTPENIHFNSFMYEPIIDMSGSHLKRLYEEIKEIQTD